MGFPARRRDRPSESQVSPKAVWYDRNPISRNDCWASINVAPHSVTTRWSYQVPSGKKALLEVVQARVTRSLAATTAGLANSSIGLIPSGGTRKAIALATIRSNTLWDKEGATIGSAVALRTGDEIDYRTDDSSTGGTCDYIGAYKVTEFDA